MNLSVGIVGLPNVGKSTLFNALLSRQIADVSNYPFCTIEPNVGIVEVPDERLKKLSEITGIRKTVPAIVKFVDIAGLVKNAHKGEGLGNQFLAHIREVDAIVHLLRAFEDENVSKAGSTDPVSDLEIVKTELILADLATLEKQKQPKGTVSKDETIRWNAISNVKKGLEQGIEARKIELSEEEKTKIEELNLLTQKPVIIVINISETDIPRIDTLIQAYKDLGPIFICAKLESEMLELNEEEKAEFMKSYGIPKSGLETLIKRCYKLLGLITFLTTTGEKEIRAWTIKEGTKTKEAAGEIHTDFEKNFVRAAVCDYQTFVNSGGWKNAKEAGKVRFEGKEYIMQEGDVVEFFINQ